MTIPDTMRAALLVGNGGPEMLEVRDDVPVPSAGPNDLLIEVSACGVNNTDINTRVGWYSRTVTSGTSGVGFTEAAPGDSTWGGGAVAFPRIQGADICGTVVAAGEGTDRSIIGRRVLVDPWLRDRVAPTNRRLARYLGSEHDGGFAEYAAVPAENVHPIDSALSAAELATFPCSWSTAEHMLQRVRLAAHQSIAIPGASGGVGSALVQLARRRDARVVAIAGATKLDQVRALGPAVAIARDTDDVPAKTVEANGSLFDVVADIVGGTDFVGWLEALHRGGRYVTSGAIAGPMVDLDLRTLYLNDLELYGATVFQPRVFTDLVGYIERGEVTPVLAGSYPLEEIHEAQEAFGRKEHIGNLVITLKR